MSPSPRQDDFSRACDECKARKVRCIRSDPSASSLGQSPPCDHCRRRSQACTLDVPLKKRGPAPKHVKRCAKRSRVVPLAVRSRGDVNSTRGGTDDGSGGSLGIQNGGTSGSAPRDGCHGSGWNDGHLQYDQQLSLTTPASTLDQLLPHSLLQHAINVYFDYVYGLVPIVHRPSFLSDFKGRRDLLPGQEEWTTTLLAVAALTMAQVPWAFRPMSNDEVKGMVGRMYGKIKDFAMGDEGEVTLARCSILYMLVIISTRLGYWGIREICLGACWRFIYDAQLHDESSYVNHDAIEKELRRRMYWLALGFDKASAAGRAQVPMITREVCATVELPTAIDDEYLTSNGYSTPPEGQTSILSGFRYISKLYDVFGKVLDSRRVDRLRPPSGILLDLKIAEVDEYFAQIDMIMHGCPLELAFKDQTSSPLFGVVDWAGDALEAIRQLFEEPEKKIPDAFLVQQGNIYTAYHMARQLTLRYRADLRSLRANEQAQLPHVPGLTFALETENLEQLTDQTAVDLLRLLKVIPLDVLSVNGDAVVNKVRFVAVSQLDALISLGERQDPLNHEQVQKYQVAQNHLRDFLTILEQIENLYSLIDPREIQM